MITVHILENSLLAKIAAMQLKSSQMAMVFGSTIHLYKVSKDEFLRNQKWVRHEIAHVKQYHNLGNVMFLLSYLFESFNKGYYHNKFEVEARNKEKDVSILGGVEFRDKYNAQLSRYESGY